MTEQDSFIREVSEEVRVERMQRLWRRFAPLIIGGLLSIVAGAAGWTWYQAQEVAAAKERGARLLEADEGVAAKAEALAALDGPAAAVAALELAAAQAAAGGVGAAHAPDRSVADDARLKRAYTDLAALEAARLDAPRKPIEEAEGLLAGLAAEGAPYRPLALELRAALRLNAGNAAGARADLEAILADPGLTRGLNIRAQQMLEILGEGDDGA